MKPLRVTVVGGGPSGLYFAYLFKKSSPQSRVIVFEQNPPDATFGFGVVLADRGLERLEQADAASYKAIHERIHRIQHQVIYHRGDAMLVDHVGYGGAITRLVLLTVLRELCEGVGVDLRFINRVEGPAQWTDAELVVGADGINSIVRGADTAAFGTRIETLTNRFAWYGTRAKFATPALNFRKHEGGYFVAHYYPYSEEMGTFVAECDAATWARLGMEAMDDGARQRLMEQIFVEDLQGQPLIYNKSVWRTFPVVVNDRWYAGNRVLIGDALHSAHFSIGSGTRIAMEDSVALWEALRASDNVSEALARFERARGPAKNKLLDAARASYSWYESFPAKMDALAPLEFVYDFMTRTGRMDDDRLRQEHPGFMKRHEAECRPRRSAC